VLTLAINRPQVPAGKEVFVVQLPHASNVFAILHEATTTMTTGARGGYQWLAPWIVYVVFRGRWIPQMVEALVEQGQFCSNGNSTKLRNQLLEHCARFNTSIERGQTVARRIVLWLGVRDPAQKVAHKRFAYLQPFLNKLRQVCRRNRTLGRQGVRVLRHSADRQIVIVAQHVAIAVAVHE